MARLHTHNARARNRQGVLRRRLRKSSTYAVRLISRELPLGRYRIHARRELDFLEREHMAHGGQESGHLAATYRQLADWGVTRNDVRQGFTELQATGFVRLTYQGACVAGGGEPSRYALTWLQTREAGVVERPTGSRAALTRSGVTTVAKARRWLKAETGGGRSARRPKPTHPRYYRW